MARKIGLPELVLSVMCFGAHAITTPPRPFIHPGVVDVESELEASLERDIGKEILAPWGERIHERVESEARILEMSSVDAIRGVIKSTQEGWEHFNRQYAKVTAIVVDYDIGLMDTRPDNAVGMNPLPICAGMGLRNQGFAYALVHELAHIWHRNLAAKDLFEEKWREISGSDYSTLCPGTGPNYELCNGRDDVRAERKKAHQDVASLSWYGATSILEDVAEYAAFAFMASNYSPSDQCKIFNEKGFEVPEGQERRVERKIDLAVKFWFFSEREGDLAKEAVHHYVAGCSK